MVGSPRGRLAAGSVVVALAALLVGCSGDSPSPGDPGASSSPSPASADSSAAESADERYGSFDAVEASGEGEAVVPLPPDVADADGGIVRMTYEGTEPLVLWSLDAEGEKQMILIDGVIEANTADRGTFDGESMWWPANPAPHGLEVEGDGVWELSVVPVSSAPPLASEGRGTRVFLYDGEGGVITGSRADTAVGMAVTEFSLPRSGGTPKNVVTTPSADAEFGLDLAPGPSVLIVSHRDEWTINLTDEG